MLYHIYIAASQCLFAFLKATVYPILKKSKIIRQLVVFTLRHPILCKFKKQKQAAKVLYSTNPQLRKRLPGSGMQMHLKKKKEASKRHYKTNPEAKKAASKNSYQKNPEAKKAASKNSYQLDPQVKKEASKNAYRKAKKAASKKSYTRNIAVKKESMNTYHLRHKKKIFVHKREESMHFQSLKVMNVKDT